MSASIATESLGTSAVEEEEATITYQDDVDKLEDWSQTGRGFHVDFGPKEIVPLEQGKLSHFSRIQF